jgi:hypothetical protein
MSGAPGSLFYNKPRNNKLVERGKKNSNRQRIERKAREKRQAQRAEDFR